MTKEFDIVVVGRGVAGHGVIHYVKASQIPVSVAWIGHAEAAKTSLDCSWHSTAIVARQGVKTGISPLGDLLVRSFDECQHFIEKEKPEGVEKVDRLHLSSEGDGAEKLVQRFGVKASQHKLLDSTFTGHHEESYLFYPGVFMPWWSNKLKKSVAEYNELALEVTRDSESKLWLVKMQKETIKAKKVVMATGAMRRYLNLSEEKLFKEVAGQYIRWTNINYEKSFILTLDGHNLIYRHASKELLLSGTNETTDLLLPNDTIFKVLAAFKERLGSFIPSTKAEVVCGLRQKGRGRLPVCENLGNEQYIIDSFYKNGYSFCHALGLDMAQILAKS
jgi:hypothetical protein